MYWARQPPATWLLARKGSGGYLGTPAVSIRLPGQGLREDRTTARLGAPPTPPRRRAPRPRPRRPAAARPVDPRRHRPRRRAQLRRRGPRRPRGLGPPPAPPARLRRPERGPEGPGRRHPRRRDPLRPPPRLVPPGHPRDPALHPGRLRRRRRPRQEPPPRRRLRGFRRRAGDGARRRRRGALLADRAPRPVLVDPGGHGADGADPRRHPAAGAGILRLHRQPRRAHREPGRDLPAPEGNPG